MKVIISKYLTMMILCYGTLAFFSCNREIEPRPNFPEATYFTPGYVYEEGGVADTITLVGKHLNGASVTVGGASVSIAGYNESYTQAFLVVPPGVTGAVRVNLSDGNLITFQTPLLNGVTEGKPKYVNMVLGDFDDGGIRPASDVNNLAGWSRTQWGMNSSSGGIQGSAPFLSEPGRLIKPSPAGGNFVYMYAENKDILTGTEGYVCTFETKNELDNDGEIYAKNFFEYPGSTLPLPDTSLLEDPIHDLDDYYVKFFVNFNGDTASRIRVYLVDESYTKASPDNGRYAFTIEYKSVHSDAYDVTNSGLYDGSTWSEVIIPISAFADKYGFGSGIDQTDPNKGKAYLTRFNKISSDITANYDTDDELMKSEKLRVTVCVDQMELIYAPSVDEAWELLTPNAADKGVTVHNIVHTRKYLNTGENAWYKPYN